jgi:adenylate cyclase
VSLAGGLLRGDWNDRVNDGLFRLRRAVMGPQRVIPTVAHVDLTDAGARELALKGGDRSAFARLVRVLSAAGARGIVFDIIFPEAGLADADRAFSAAAAKAGTVYLPVVLTPGARAGAAVQQASAPWVWHPRVLKPGRLMSAGSATLSYPSLDAAARGTGAINTEPDQDGTFRRLPLVISYGGGVIPTLALRAACDILDVDPSAMEVSPGLRIRLPGARMPDGSVRTLDIPVDRGGRMILDFPGVWGEGFTHYSFSGLLAAETDAELADQAAAELDGATLVVADLTTSTGDYGPTPVEGTYPLAGLHSSALGSILTGRFLRAPAWHQTLLLNLAFAALLWLAAWRLRPVAWSACALAAWVLLGAGEFGLFAGAGLMPGLAAPTLGLVFALVAVNGYRFLLAEREKLLVRARMERYFAPRLMAKILRSPDRLMSAEKKVITVLFSDISGFTSWCTTHEPDDIHRTLNEYFEVMTEIIFRHDGTVDKFIGDGLMAFFGDPLDQSDHALRAVRCAVEMQQAVRTLRARWEAEGRMSIHIRIGINSGEMVVGDMGSRRIMAYTAIGANVNLASRLESKAPVDGVLVSAPVYRAVEAAVQARFAGKITAKGISEEFETWEILVP